MSEPTKRTVSLEVSMYTPETMFLRQAVGTETDAEGGKFEMSVNMGGYVPIVRLPDGRWVTFGWEALVGAADSAGKQGVGAVLAEKPKKRQYKASAHAEGEAK